MQVDLLVLGEAGKIQGVIAATVPDAEHQGIPRLKGTEEVPPGIGVEAIGRIVGTGAPVGAIELLDGRDIVHQRGGGVEGRVIAGEVLAAGGFAPVAHHAVTQGVLRIGGIARVARPRTVVVAGMWQAEDMPDFMGQGLAAIVVQPRTLVVLVTVGDAVPGLPAQSRYVSWPDGLGRSASHLVVAKGDMAIAAVRRFGKRDMGGVRPGLHGQHRLGFLQGTERLEPGEPQRIVIIIGQQLRCVGEAVGQLYLPVPVGICPGRRAVRQICRGLFHRVGRLSIGCHAPGALGLCTELTNERKQKLMAAFNMTYLRIDDFNDFRHFHTLSMEESGNLKRFLRHPIERRHGSAGF